MVEVAHVLLATRRGLVELVHELVLVDVLTHHLLLQTLQKLLLVAEISLSHPLVSKVILLLLGLIALILLLSALVEILSSLSSDGVSASSVVLHVLVLLLHLLVLLSHSLELVEVRALCTHVFLRAHLLLELHHVLPAKTLELVAHVAHSWLGRWFLPLSSALEVGAVVAHEALHA